MKLKRNTALVLAGSLALATVPMNVFAYTGPSMVGDMGTYENMDINIKDLKATVTEVTKTPGRTLLSVDRIDTTITNESNDYDYIGRAPKINLSFNAENMNVEGDVIFEVELDDAQFIEPTGVEGTTSMAAARGTMMNTYVAAGNTVPTMMNVYELPVGVYFEYLEEDTARFIVDADEFMMMNDEAKAGVNKIAIPLIARTTSANRPATITVSAYEGSTFTEILEAAPLVAYQDLSSAAIEVDKVETGRNYINNASFELSEPSIGFFATAFDAVNGEYEPLRLRLKNGDFVEDSIMVKGFGLTTADYTVDYTDDNEAEITFSTELLSTGVPGDLEFTFDIKGGREDEVVVVARWEDLISGSLSAVVGQFTDYDYDFELADDVNEKDFEYPVLNSNFNFDATEEEDYEVLRFTLSDHVANSILWDQRDFEIRISDNAKIEEMKITANYANEMDLMKVFTIEETDEEGDTISYSSDVNEEEKVLSIDNRNEVTFELLVSAREVNEDDITVMVMGEGVSEDSDELKIGEFKRTISVDHEVMSVATNLGPQKVSNIQINELESGIFTDDDIFRIRLEAPDYLDAFAALGNFGFYDEPEAEMLGDGEFEVETEIVDKDYMDENPMHPVEEGDLLVMVDVINDTEDDETASILLSDVKVTLGILYSVPEDVVSAEIMSFDESGMGQSIYGNSEESDYFMLDGSEELATGVYYDDHFADDYNTDVEMTIGKGTFTAVDSDGEIVTGAYASEDSSDASIYAPMMVGNNSYVAIRSFANTIGGEVEWDAIDRMVYIYPQGKANYINGKGALATVKQDSPNMVTFFEPGKAVVDLFIVDQMGQKVEMVNMNGVNFLPIRFFAETIYNVEVMADENFSTTKTFVLN